MERSGEDATVVVERDPEGVARRLAGVPGVAGVRSEPLNLEEIFLELVGGGR